jgi:xyloglucan-specific endo-beta-1,4-glucanase
MRLHFATLTPLLILPAVTAEICGQYQTLKTGSYNINNNLWGIRAAASGSQCTSLDSGSTSSVSWHTSWSWKGGSKHVKSFSNAGLNFTPKKISDISAIPTVFRYSYSGAGVVADVAYDTFLDSTPGSSTNAYEVMIWLAAYGGAMPISKTGKPVATTDLAGTSWNLYDGYNGDMRVFSFVSPSPVTAFSGDLKEFFDYLTNNQYLGSGNYLNSEFLRPKEKRD